MTKASKNSYFSIFLIGVKIAKTARTYPFGGGRKGGLSLRFDIGRHLVDFLNYVDRFYLKHGQFYNNMQGTRSMGVFEPIARFWSAVLVWTFSNALLKYVRSYLNHSVWSKTTPECNRVLSVHKITGVLNKIIVIQYFSAYMYIPHKCRSLSLSLSAYIKVLLATVRYLDYSLIVLASTHK